MNMVVPLFASSKNKNVEVPQWEDNPYGSDQLQVTVFFVCSCKGYPTIDRDVAEQIVV